MEKWLRYSDVNFSSPHVPAWVNTPVYMHSPHTYVHTYSHTMKKLWVVSVIIWILSVPKSSRAWSSSGSSDVGGTSRLWSLVEGTKFLGVWLWCGIGPLAPSFIFDSWKPHNSFLHNILRGLMFHLTTDPVQWDQASMDWEPATRREKNPLWS